MRLHLIDHKSLKFEKLYVAQAVCRFILLEHWCFSKEIKTNTFTKMAMW